LSLKWNPNNLDIKTRTVEKTLEPLVMQVTTLVSSKSLRKSKGKSKRAHVLVAAVERATSNFVEQGESIAASSPGIKAEMLMAVEEVKEAGATMSSTSREFASDPCSSGMRGSMVRAARNLLSAVTRLLILADMIDVNLLVQALGVVEDDLDFIKSVSSEAELMDGIGRFGKSSSDLMSQAAKRQNELKDNSLRDDIAAARAVLKKHSMMLLSTSKAYVQHPELAVAKENRDYVLRQVCEAVNTISDVAKGRIPRKVHLDGSGELASALDDFDESVLLDPVSFNESLIRPGLEERLESIISGAALLADSNCTRDERRERIVAECNAVRQALQDLLDEYTNNSGTNPSEELDVAIGAMGRKTGDLRRHLRKAAVDHVSDSFLETSVPLIDLVEAARDGREKDVEEFSSVFTEHVKKLVEVANLACSLSANEDGIKMVRYAAQYMENLYPQVINAAKILVGRTRSKVAQENMDIFKNVWENQLKILTDSVDDITTVADFLAVSEDHILEDVNKCCSALQAKDVEGLTRIAGVIKGRSSRISGVVAAEMDNYEPGLYTENVLRAVRHLQAKVIPKFSSCIDDAVDVLTSLMINTVDENEFIDASRLVYDGIREVRRAVLMNRGEEDMDSDTEWEAAEHYEVGTLRPDIPSRQEDLIDEYPDISGITTAREAMKKLPEEEKMKIAEQVEGFRTEKIKFDQEVSKWDDTGNDVIGLAKRMCVIMMEMTDFTRGRGNLKTTMDVIRAAKRISEAGTQLDKLARQIADQCPESTTKKDLLAYLQRIALYCHQLNITSKVKADVQNVSGELIVSGLDSATSLIQAAKNLMNAVVVTVKASYVASTKYPRQAAEMGFTSPPLVVWRMKAPEKKPLVRRETSGEMSAVMRKGSIKTKSSPLKELSVFQGPGCTEKQL